MAEGAGVRSWVFLAAAILTEVAGTLALRAFQDHRGWLAVVVPGYVASFIFLAAVLRAGMPVDPGDDRRDRIDHRRRAHHRVARHGGLAGHRV